MKNLPQILALLVVLGGKAVGQGTTLWNESVNGPFSEDPAQPTSLSPLQAGINSIIGSTEVVPTPPNWAGHPNIFTIHIPTGFVVQALQLQVDKPNVWAWIGNTGFSSDLAYTLNATSGDLLPQWGLGTIPSGSYGMYLENSDLQSFVSVANFRLDFVVQAVPEPGPLWLLLGGLSFLGFLRHRKPQRRQQ